MAEAVAKGDTAIAYDALLSLRIAAVLILIRAIETVCVSTQRAFGRYGIAIQMSVEARVASLLLAWWVPWLNRSASAVMIAMLIVSCLALAAQMRQLMQLLGVRLQTPLFGGAMARGLLGFGVFTWLQAVVGLLAGQVDRLVAGAALGASAVAVYACCVQLAQPIYGVTAAGLHFMFLLLSADESRRDLKMLRRTIAMVFAANLVFVLGALAILLVFGGVVLRLWMGTSMATAAGSVLPIVAWGAALSALSVTGCYALLAAGRPASVAALSVAGGAAMAIALSQSAHFGLSGIAYSRLLPGCMSMLVYIPLVRYLTQDMNARKAVEHTSMLGEA
jgi:O-antigen/teichoic acid export membrane protein